jgi:hypothetical protein
MFVSEVRWRAPGLLLVIVALSLTLSGFNVLGASSIATSRTRWPSETRPPSSATSLILVDSCVALVAFASVPWSISGGLWSQGSGELRRLGIRYISTGPRSSLDRFHDRVLELDGAGGWRVVALPRLAACPLPA